jgi:hypothetical protein
VRDHLLAVPHHVQHQVLLQVRDHLLAVRLQAHRVHTVVQIVHVRTDQYQIVHVRTDQYQIVHVRTDQYQIVHVRTRLAAGGLTALALRDPEFLKPVGIREVVQSLLEPPWVDPMIQRGFVHELLSR